MSKEYNENQILNDIHNAASKVEIPDSVKPENMMQYIASKKSEGYFEGVNNIQSQEKEKARKRKMRRLTIGIGAVAAVLAVVIVGVSITAVNSKVGTLRALHNKVKTENSEGVYVLSSYKDLATYTVADNHKYSKPTLEDFMQDMSNFVGEIFYKGVGEELNGSADMNWEGAPSYGATLDAMPESSAGNEDYYDTNTRTEGVGEADIVKTDGEYIYYLCDDTLTTEIVVVSADGENSQVVCRIPFRDDIGDLLTYSNGGYQGIEGVELLVYEDRVAVIVSFYNGILETTIYEDGSSYTSDKYVPNTAILVYDISDIQEPEKISALYMEGEYSSCKYVNGYVYIFTSLSKITSLGIDDYTEEEARKLLAPSVCGEYMACDDIFVAQAEDYDYYNIIATIDMNNPSQFKDTKAVLGDNNNTELYVSANNIYVISNMYDEYVTYVGKDDKEGTVLAANKAEIVRIAYKDGVLKSTGRTEIAGELGDEFDIDEYDGYLRMAVSKTEYNVSYTMKEYTFYDGHKWVDAAELATTRTWYSESRSSVMYVLDDKLQLVGEVMLQAEEEVYGVRFDGDIAYVVTYRQMDPLFTVDLSDPTKPTVMGALKIPGFSEYLHIWDENTLLGLGYDEYRNIKISTYDISDKYNVTENYVKSLEDVYYSPALANHRAIFISPEKNLLGFYGEGYFIDEYDRRYEGAYNIYEYVDGEFKTVISYPVESAYDYAENIRGLYIGEYVYLVVPSDGVHVFNMSTYSNVAIVK